MSIKDIDPKIDPAFKAVVKEKRFLLSFLNDLFEELKMPQAVDLTYVETEIDGIGYFGKGARLDVCVELKGKSKIVVEMQIQDHLDMPHRMQFYAGKVFTNQFKRGKSHANDEILQTFVIALLAFELEGLDDAVMVHRFCLYDERNKIELPDGKLNVITIELPKLSKYLKEKGQESGLGFWSAFFRNRKKDQLLAQRYDMTKEAKVLLDSKKADDDFMTSYAQAKAILDDEESRLKTYAFNRYEKGIRDGEKIGEQKGILEGEKIGEKRGEIKGKQKAKAECYQRLLASGMSEEQARKLSGLE